MKPVVSQRFCSELIMESKRLYRQIWSLTSVGKLDRNQLGLWTLDSFPSWIGLQLFPFKTYNLCYFFLCFIKLNSNKKCAKSGSNWEDVWIYIYVFFLRLKFYGIRFGSVINVDLFTCILHEMQHDLKTF